MRLSIQIMDMQKRINLKKMTQKQGEAEIEHEQKGCKSYFWYKMHTINRHRL